MTHTPGPCAAAASRSLSSMNLAAQPPVAGIVSGRSAAAGFVPGCENLVDGGPHLVAGLVARYAGHEQCVVTGVLMAYRGGNGPGDSGYVQSAACCGPAHPAAAPAAGVLGDRGGTRGRASRE